MAETEADTCRRYVTPALIAAGWDSHTQIAEQRAVTDGRVLAAGARPRRAKPQRLDYLLRYTRDLPLAVVEAKASDLPAGTGMQQAIEYAEKLKLPFAYATNGLEIIEHDFLTGVEGTIARYPSPDDLWFRYKTGTALPAESERLLLAPYFVDAGRPPRHYQYTSVNRTTDAIGRGQDRVLLTLATGTGKSFIAFQICWRLWQNKWNRTGEDRRARILYLADRNVLLDQPRLGVFAPFGDALHRIDGEAVLSREMYFATYQQLAADDRRPGLYRDFPIDFFDLIVVDECHRGSASDESNWREILDYFEPAAKLGMTATPSREDTRDTYGYFGPALVEYTLAEGIDDGFLAPYKIRRVTTDRDALGYRPAEGETDRFGRVVPDKAYGTPNYDADLVLTQRVEAHARNITDYLRATDRHAKTIVFCRDQEHALNMRNALVRLNPDLVRDDPNYVVRISSDEGEIGQGHLANFQDIDAASPVIVTSSDMLTTGVDAPTVKNVVLARWVTSLPMFKQMIGRGTRLKTDYDKWYFTIHDLTGAATILFADPDFDGYPDAEMVQDEGDAPEEPGTEDEAADPIEDEDGPAGYEYLVTLEDRARSQKYYLDDVTVEIVAETVYHLGANGKRISSETYEAYVAKEVRALVPSVDALRPIWSDQRARTELLDVLEQRGIDCAALKTFEARGRLDDYDVLREVAFGAPGIARAERVRRVERQPDFWAPFQPEAREVLSALLARFETYGLNEMQLPGALDFPPLNGFGSVVEVARRFGGVSELREAVLEMQRRLYLDGESL